MGTLSFAQGEQSKTVSVEILDNNTNEGNRSIVLGLTSMSSGTLPGGNTSTVTIVDTDLVAWSVSGPSQSVTEADGATMTFQVRRSGDISVSDTIYYQIGGGTASAGTDFTPLPRTQLTFAAGEEVKTVTLNILNDSIGEEGKNITLGIDGASRGTISGSRASGALLDDDVGTVWTVASGGGVAEGGVISFTVTRSGNSGAQASVNIGFAGGNTTLGVDHAGFSADPNAWSSELLTFAPGEMSKVITIQTIEENIPEPDEAVTVILFNPSTGVVGTQGWESGGSSATAYVLDNDSIKWSISGDDTYEATGFMTYTITRSGDLSQSNTLDYSLTGGSAVAGVNYVALPAGAQTLVFNEGESSKVVTVEVLDDQVSAVDSTLIMSISNPSSGVLLNQSRTNTIQDGAQVMRWYVNGAGYFAEDAGSATFTVRRTNDFSTRETVHVFTSDIQTTAGIDYVPIDQILTFEAGESEKTVTVTIISDSITEVGAEHFVLSLDNPSRGVASGNGFGPIIDPDQAVWQAKRLAENVSEGSGGVAFLINRVGNLSAATVEYRVVDENNSNAVVTNWTQLNFAQGESSKVVYLPISDNNTVATVNPKYVVNMQNWSMGIVSNDGWTTAPSYYWNTTILDNDQVFLNLQGPNTNNWYNTVLEATNGSAEIMTFRVVRTGNTDVTTVVDYQIDSTVSVMNAIEGRATIATEGEDYVVLPAGQLTFGPGETVKTILVQLVDDLIQEGYQFITMKISNGLSSNSMTTTLQTVSVTPRIIDNDIPSGVVTTQSSDFITNYGVGDIIHVIDLMQGDDTLKLSANATHIGGGLFQGGSNDPSWMGGVDTLDASDISGQLTWQIANAAYAGGIDGSMAYSDGGTNQFFNFEILKLGTGSNTLTSTATSASTVQAFAHHTVTLGTGGDTLYIKRDAAGVGAGTFNGGNGSDTLSFANASEAVNVVYTGSGAGTFAATSATVGLNGSFSSFEALAYGSNVANISVASGLALGGWFVVTGGGAGDTVNFASAASGTAVYMDTEAGGSGGDNVTMSASGDYVYAGNETTAGNDTFNAGSGGYDRLSYEHALSTSALAIVITGKSTQGWDGTVSATAVGTDSFVGFDEVYGGKGVDTFTSSVTTWAGGLALSGLGGNDNFNFSNLTSGSLTIYDTTNHGSGADSATVGNGAQLSITSGNETVVGNDTWTAGSHTSDSLNYSASTAATTWALTANAGSTGFDGTVTGTSVGTDTFTGFENFTLSGQNETVTVSGARGVSLNLGAGNDIFTGGSAFDIVNLGGGNDTVVFKYLSNTVKGGHSEDSVRGFAFTNDTLKFDTAMFTGAVDANNLTNYMRMSTTAGQLHCLQIDRDGTGSTWGWTNFAWFDSPDGTLPITADLTTMFNASRIVIA